MLSALRRKPPEVRWAFGRMIPSIAELKARERTWPKERSSPRKTIQKRPQKARNHLICHLAEERRSVQVSRAADSSGARGSTSTISAIGHNTKSHTLILDAPACTPHLPIYINQPSFFMPDPSRSSNSGFSGAAGEFDEGHGRDMATMRVPATPARAAPGASTASAASGRYSPYCSASATSANSWRCHPDRGTRDGGGCDADRGDRCASPPTTPHALPDTATASMAPEGGEYPGSHLAGEPAAGCVQPRAPAAVCSLGSAGKPEPALRDYEYAAGATALKVPGGGDARDLAGGEGTEDGHYIQGSGTHVSLQVSAISCHHLIV